MPEQNNAVREIKDSESVISEAFAATRRMQKEMDFPRTLRADWLETPLGTLLIAGDENRLHLVCFIEKAGLVRKAALLQKNLRAWLELGQSPSVDSAKRELGEYFAGERRVFTTPVSLDGTAFQTKAWEGLLRIPFGGSVSYAGLANALGKPSAFRAVAQASSQNPVAIMVPCHRVINGDGSLGGYNAGIERKRWLLDFEKGILEREKAGSHPE